MASAGSILTPGAPVTGSAARPPHLATTTLSPTSFNEAKAVSTIKDCPPMHHTGGVIRKLERRTIRSVISVGEVSARIAHCATRTMAPEMPTSLASAYGIIPRFNSSRPLHAASLASIFQCSTTHRSPFLSGSVNDALDKPAIRVDAYLRPTGSCSLRYWTVRLWVRHQPHKQLPDWSGVSECTYMLDPICRQHDGTTPAPRAHQIEHGRGISGWPRPR